MPKKKHTYEEVVSFVESNSDSKLLESEYVNAETKMRFLCCCGNEFVTDFNHFRNGRRVCTECAKRRQYDEKRLSLDEVKRRLSEKSVTYISGEYENRKSFLSVKCSCGNVFSATFDNILFGSGKCLTCLRKEQGIRNAKNIDEIRTFAIENGAKLISTKYENAHSKMEFQCQCGKSFSTTWNRFSSGQTRCRTCSKRESSGEMIIREWLEDHGITYDVQKTFDMCGDKRPYPFDFYIPIINTCIEYDGEFHYFDKGGKLKDTQKRDAFKTAFCKDNGIKLIRIPYYEKDSIGDVLCKLIPR